MIKKYIALLIVLMSIQNNFAQKSINNYKYVVVPYKFDFVNNKDQYRINTLTRHLFNTNGFTAYFDEQKLPSDLDQNRCLAMYANVIKERALLNIKLFIEIKDCRGVLIFKSDIGKSKEKGYAKGYNEAIRDAFKSISFLNYKYIPEKSDNTDKTSQVEKESTGDKLVQIKQEKEELKTKNDELAKTVTASQNSTDASITKLTEPNEKSINSSKVISDKTKNTVLGKKEHAAKNRLYQYNGKKYSLKEHQTGYDLVDINGNVVYKLLSTSQKTVYIAVGNFKQGVALHDIEKQSISIEFYDNNKKRVTETFVML